MKSLLILLIVSTSYAYPVAKTWTFNELKREIPWNNRAESSKDPEMKTKIDAFDEMMASIYTGQENGSVTIGYKRDPFTKTSLSVCTYLMNRDSWAVVFTDDYVQAIMLSPSGSKVWTTDELTQSLNSSDTDLMLRPFIEQAFFHLVQENRRENETKQDTVEVWVPALDISTWTNKEVSIALKDPELKPDFLPRLKEAQKKFEEAEEKGEKLESVKVITPIGVIPKPEGQPIIFVARPVHENMLANRDQIVAFYSKTKRL